MSFDQDFDIVSDLLNVVNKGSGAWTRVLERLDEDSEVFLRFYSKGMWVMPVKIHTQFVKGKGPDGEFLGYKVLCPIQCFYKTDVRMFPNKKECPYCGKDEPGIENGRRTEDRYCWLAWNHDSAQKIVVAFPGNKQGAVPKILAQAQLYAKKRSDITGRDVTIRRTGSGQKSSYDPSWGDKDEADNPFKLPAGVAFPTTKEEQQREMLEMLIDAWCPEFRDGELKMKGVVPVQQQRNSVDSQIASLLNGNDTAEIVYDDEALPRVEI